MTAFIRTVITCSAAMSAVALSLMLIEALAVKRRSTSVRALRWAWLVVMLGFICPIRPDLSALRRVIDVPRLPVLPELAQRASDRAATQLMPMPDMSAAPAAAWHVDWAGVIALIYALGVLTVLLMAMIKHWRFKRTVMRWSRPADAGLAELSQARMVVSKAVNSPLLMGAVRPVIVLPDCELPLDDLRAMIIHEEHHRAAHDVLIQHALLLARAINWFNPLMPIIAAEITLKCEQFADESTLRTCKLDRRAYVSAILAAAVSRRVPLTTGFIGGKRNMKRRLTAMYCHAMPKIGALILAVTMLMTLFVPSLAALAADAEPEASAQPEAPAALIGGEDPADALQDMLTLMLSRADDEEMRETLAMMMVAAADGMTQATNSLDDYEKLEDAYRQKGMTAEEITESMTQTAQPGIMNLMMSAPEEGIATRIRLMLATGELFPEIYAQLALGQFESRSIICSILAYEVATCSDSIAQICEVDAHTRAEAMDALLKWTEATGYETMYGPMEYERAEIDRLLKAESSEAE